MVKIIIKILEEIRNQIINLLFVIIIDFMVLMFDKYYYTFLNNVNFLEKNYICLTISFIIYLLLLPVLLPWQTELMMKYNKRNQHLNKKDKEKQF